MLIYYPFSHYDGAYRSEVFPLLKAFIKKDGFTDDQRKSLYGVSEVDFVFTDVISKAQVVILPMSWGYYTQTKQLNIAIALIEEAEKQNKVVWSINSGDFGIQVPFFKNVIVFRQGGYVANNQKGHKGYPSFVDDYLAKNNLEAIYLKSTYLMHPVVGFCGQANASKINAFKEVFKQFARNIRTQIGLSHLEKQKIVSTSFLRAYLLDKLEINEGVISNFIKREKYRAGIEKGASIDETSKEFYQNILASQYVLCVRGAGNFSVRFYETLMMGRIPLYVHTDGYLPLSENIDWKEHVVWVDYKDRDNIAAILFDFHQKLNAEDLILLFEKNRKLWEEKLTLSGFFETEETKIL
ncbi:exostosin domain-containing protein [Lacinutrix sp. MEBiC02595]